MMTREGCSTERVRTYRQRQRDASRKLVRFYLGAETAAMLEQLASGQPHAALAEALLTTAISQSWEAHQAQQADSRIRCAHPHASPEPADAAVSRLAQFPGRRRGFAASDTETCEASSSQGVARNTVALLLGPERTSASA